MTTTTPRRSPLAPRPATQSGDETTIMLKNEDGKKDAKTSMTKMQTRSMTTASSGMNPRTVRADENASPETTRVDGCDVGTPMSNRVETVKKADALSARLLNSPSARDAVASLERAATATRAGRNSGRRGRGESPLVGSAGKNGSGLSSMSWKEEARLTRESVERARAASRETPTSSSHLYDDEDDDGEGVDDVSVKDDVVEALERRLEASEQDGSPSSALLAARETREKNAALREQVEEMRRTSKSAKEAFEGDEDVGDVVDEEEDADADDSCVSPNVDDPQVAMAIARVRLLEERKTKEARRELVELTEREAVLKARVHELELELEDRDSELEASARKVRLAQQDVGRVRDVWAKMDEANVRCTKAETERCAAQEEAQKAQLRVLELEAEVERLRRENRDEKKQVGEMELLHQLATSAHEVKSEEREAELAEALAEIEEAKAEIERLETCLDEVQEIANEKTYYETEYERMEEELENAQREITWRKATEEELRKALERSEGEIVLHRAENSKAESDVYALVEAKNTELDKLRVALVNAEKRATEKEASALRAERELSHAQAQKLEFEESLRSVSIDGSSKRHELERDLATALVNVEDLTNALEAVQYELKQARVEKEKAVVDMHTAQQDAAEAASKVEYKLVDLTTELEGALEQCAHLQQQLSMAHEREQDLLSQLDDAFIAAKLAEEETEVDMQDEESESEDFSSPTPVKATKARSTSTESRKKSVANLVATNRDLVDLTSRQSHEISRLQAERSRLKSEISKLESTTARLKKLKDENYSLACKYKANLQKTSEEIKARQLVESRLHEYERATRTLEITIEELRGELKRAHDAHIASMKDPFSSNTAAAEEHSLVVKELRDEVADLKRALDNLRKEKNSSVIEERATTTTTTTERKQPSTSEPEASFADFLAKEVSDAEREMNNTEAYAVRLQEEIAKVSREILHSKSPLETEPERYAETIEAARETANVALSVSESTKQRALYYKGVAKMLFRKLQSLKLDARRIDALKTKLDAVLAETPLGDGAAAGAKTPSSSASMRTPLSAIGREHSFLLESV
jgi:chromosome segregation ATPase